MKSVILAFALLFCLAGCEKPTTIVNNVPEREANEMLVFLASKGIPAVKIQAASTGPGGGTGDQMWSISVDQKQEIDAISILNRNGLPRQKTTSLLEIFAKSGLVSSEREESIRYQAGLAAQLAGTINQIDGVIDTQVEISIPKEEGISIPGEEPTEKKRITAAIFVKHQGILDDPNSHLVTKIKRLVSGSISGLDINDVTVISDRSRFTDITLSDTPEEITPSAKEYVSIWSIVMSKGSASRFRVVFFFLIFGLIAFALICGWMFWKFYPVLRKRGMKKLFNPIPFRSQDKDENEDEGKEPPADQV